MKRVWTEEKDHLLRRHYPKRDLDWLAQRLGVTRAALKTRARILGLQRKVHRREKWTDKHLDYLRTHYADMRAEDIARKVHHSVQSVWRTASKLGLKKSPEFLAQWGHLVSSTDGAKSHQFVKGHQPANKGNRQNCDLSNLELISRGDSARLCVQNETPEARRERVAKCHVTRNKTIRRDRLRIHWGLEPYSKLVKRW